MPIKPSFLFEPNVAADTDNQTVYELGLNGLAELAQEDGRFKPFQDTLFAQSANNGAFDRGMTTKAENLKLDKSISSLLRILSPYFMLQGAHKILEFLIRRYQIQERNVDVVLECILPYHEVGPHACYQPHRQDRESAERWV